MTLFSGAQGMQKISARFNTGIGISTGFALPISKYQTTSDIRLWHSGMTLIHFPATRHIGRKVIPG
jgi:hypothetical protein